MRSDALDAEPETIIHSSFAVGSFLDAVAARQQQSLIARFFGRSPIPSDLRSEYRIACGEITVADALSQLGDDWVVLHGIRVGNGVTDPDYIDHIVIGPAGVFTISIRQGRPGAVWIDGGVVVVDGERMPYIRDSEFEAVRAAQLISDSVGSRVEVMPCLVLVSPKSLTVAKPPHRVAVLTPRDIRPWLKGFSRVLSEDRLAVIKDAVLAQANWYDIRTPPAGLGSYLDRFRRFQTAVNQARHLRLTWLTGTIVLAWLVFVIGIGGYATSLLQP